MSIEAKVIEDSISREGKRITTFQLKYPRFVHSELMTHRVFSRNASSSRAIPIMKMIKDVWNEPAEPVHWGKNQSGMQARSVLEGTKLKLAKTVWNISSKVACVFAYTLFKIGLHKQISNRILEPWQHIHVVLTSTEYENFFKLRDHPDAQPEIRELAKQMKSAMIYSIPRVLNEGEWHLPYITDSERRNSNIEILRACSAARCARVSYLLHDGNKTSIEKDLELFNQLATRPFTDKRGNVLTEDDPVHYSPLEHQATPDVLVSNRFAFELTNWESPSLHGNFNGWIQYRRMHEQTDK